MSSDGSPKTQVIDARGYSCPYPQYLTMRALQTLSENGILEIVLDNLPSLETVQDYARKHGCRFVSANRIGDNVWKITIRK
ncbi:sulfurtransferase TusA family protein [Candidatus Bathyarchaeota archaeon]|nr:sulfurtransferase TusA family protein [Candidatus Bathyarchaeota archaeon]MBS7629334.1 sulfurtransferase TusA family protein [Candidatus Bathyarchaeota archaeon]